MTALASAAWHTGCTDRAAGSENWNRLAGSTDSPGCKTPQFRSNEMKSSKEYVKLLSVEGWMGKSRNSWPHKKRQQADLATENRNEEEYIAKCNKCSIFQRFCMCMWNTRYWVGRENTKINKSFFLSHGMAYWLKGWPPEDEACLHSLQAVQHWASRFTSLCLSFLVFKMGICGNIPQSIN